MSRLCTECTHCKCQIGLAFPKKHQSKKQENIVHYMKAGHDKIIKDIHLNLFSFFRLEDANIRCAKGRWIDLEGKEHRFKSMELFMAGRAKRSIAKKYKTMAETCEHFDGEINE